MLSLPRTVKGVPVTRGRIVAALLAVSPWSWWLIRGASSYAELLAIGAPLIIAVGFVASAALTVRSRSWIATLAIVSWLVVGLLVIVAPLRPESGPAPIAAMEIYAINTTGHESDNVAIADAVADADLVVALELTRFLDGRLAEQFPYQEVAYELYNETNYAVPDVGIYSRAPITPLPSEPWLPGRRVRVDGPNGQFVLYALHVPQPGFSNEGWRLRFPRRARLIRRIADAARSEELPTVIAGDLNATDRGADYRLLRESFEDGVRSRWAAPTSTKSSLLWRALLLRIDHILHSSDLCSDAGGRVDLPGSEHDGVRARIGPCPA